LTLSQVGIKLAQRKPQTVGGVERFLKMMCHASTG